MGKMWSSALRARNNQTHVFVWLVDAEIFGENWDWKDEIRCWGRRGWCSVSAVPFHDKHRYIKTLCCRLPVKRYQMLTVLCRVFYKTTVCFYIVVSVFQLTAHIWRIYCVAVLFQRHNSNCPVVSLSQLNATIVITYCAALPFTRHYSNYPVVPLPQINATKYVLTRCHSLVIIC